MLSAQTHARLFYYCYQGALRAPIVSIRRLGKHSGWISLVKMNGGLWLVCKGWEPFCTNLALCAQQMSGSPEFLAVCATRGLSKAGANQCSFLERGGAQNESGAVLGAGKVDVQKPVSAFKALTDQHR